MAARLLARAPRTEADLEARLVRLGYRRETAAAAVARCRELGWVGDAAFAQERASALRARGAGSLKITADLAARGLPEALVEAAVAESLAGEREHDWARRLLERRRLHHTSARPRAARSVSIRRLPAPRALNARARSCAKATSPTQPSSRQRATADAAVSRR